MNAEINTKSTKAEKNRIARIIDVMLTLSKSEYRGAGNFNVHNIVDALYTERGLTVSVVLVRQIIKYWSKRAASPIVMINADWFRVMTNEEEAKAFPPTKNMIKTLARMERARAARIGNNG